MSAVKKSSDYVNPYLAGFCLGLVLLSAYVLAGQGLGASGAFASTLSWLVGMVSPEQVAGNGFYEKYLDPGRAPHPLLDWLVIEVAGVMLGGLVSSLLAGRWRLTVERGARLGAAPRLLLAFAGGVLMAVGAQFARGCTSGQALSGGALLNLGSWVFMMCVFAGAYLLAYVVRRAWL